MLCALIRLPGVYIHRAPAKSGFNFTTSRSLTFSNNRDTRVPRSPSTRIELNFEVGSWRIGSSSAVPKRGDVWGEKNVPWKDPASKGSRYQAEDAKGALLR